MTSNNLSTDHVDVVVIGGGSAGLGAAIALGRSLRSVVVVDAGQPRNAPSDHAHNVLGREGISPRELITAGRAEAQSYGVRFLDDEVTAASRAADRFLIVTASGTEISARRVILATGLVDVLPDVDGVAQCWGKTVLHCPYCHGYEVRGQRIGILATGPMATHQALLFNQLSENVTVFAHTATPDDESLKKLAALGITVVDGEVARLDREGTQVSAVVLADGTTYPLDAVVVGPKFEARAEVYEWLGGEVTEHPMGHFVETEPMGKTAIDGVWAAGNIADLSAMVSVSSGAGVMAGAAVNADLVVEDIP
ncbi:putative oxidoreductase [Gordonia effusa NBRC 100432]|uniref:Putative oxidoreductase n=1 Tax=Gordonia effusa NBRC 100432 TaxID=1077974 RepID=H0R605_9ACTN|nr:NAD(P)/FAD-dependent oxidoreductase [Gordonia effusa]GAB20506.1 putative oxidoreductase [Gordonia effusa NBRC 100432]